MRFVELGEYLCEVCARQYWRVEKLRSFDAFLQKRVADSRRKAYYLMAIHEKLKHVRGVIQVACTLKSPFQLAHSTGLPSKPSTLTVSAIRLPLFKITLALQVHFCESAGKVLF